MQRKIGSFQRRLKVSIGSRPSLAFPDRLLHRRKAFLLFAVIIFCNFKTGLASRFDKSLMQGNITFAPGDVQRPISAAPIGIPALSAFMPILHPQKIRKHIRIRPAISAAVCPVIVIAGMTAHIDHTIDGGGTTYHFTSWTGQFTAAKMWLRFGKIAPIITGHIHWIGEGARHLDEGARICPAVFQHQN